MVFTVLDTPRTEVGDQTRLSAFNDLDFTTENSIPSPSKESNDLLKHIRGMRGQGNSRDSRSRLPLTERRNIPAKGEFTPLLKSATRHNFRRSIGSSKESNQRHLETPPGLKASFLGRNSPGLPLNSSMILEEHSASLANNDDEVQASIVAPPISSSSALSTPLAITARPGDGPLDKAGNLATLRDQEARLEQIDKENFSLKLKIHFLEEALRKNGKEFNETAVKENTELKVDKINLQRDRKKLHKLLAQAEKDLELYRLKLREQAEKAGTVTLNDASSEELEQLREKIAEQESVIRQLQERLDTSEDIKEQLEKLQDDCSDLEAEIRQKDQELDEKDEQLRGLRDSGVGKEDLEQELKEKAHQLGQREDEIEALQEDLENLESSTGHKLDEKQKELDRKDGELRKMEERVRAMEGDQSVIHSKGEDMEELRKQLHQKDNNILELKQQVDSFEVDRSVIRNKTREVDDQKSLVEELRSKLQNVESSLALEIQQKNKKVEEKDLDIKTLQQKLESTDDRDRQTEDLQDQIADLEAEVREKERLIEERDEALEDLNEKLQTSKQQAEDELNDYENRVQELGSQQLRHINELQELRDSADKNANGSNQALNTAQDRIRDLEAQLEIDREQEKQLQSDKHKLQDTIKGLEAGIRIKDANYDQESDKWAAERRSLEFEKSRAMEQTTSMQTTINHLKETKGTLSERELRLQRDLEEATERHQSAQESLQNHVDQLSDESQKRHRALQEAERQLRDTKIELATIKNRRIAETDEETLLRQKIQDLEDEVEVLQNSLDEDAEQARSQIEAAKREADSLREQIKSLQQDLQGARNERNHFKSELKTALENELEREIRRAQQHEKYNPDLVRRNEEAALEAKELEIKLREAQNQLNKAGSEKNSIQDELLAAKATLEDLRRDNVELEANRGTAENQSKDLRQQIQSLRREHERQMQSKEFKYERDIDNLEQDLVESNQKEKELEAENQSAQQKISRLESKIQSIEAQRSSGDAIAGNQRDLYEMLRDAKLEAEDLAIQIQDRDSRITNAVAKEAELREQLKRIRDERTAQSSRADVVTRELESLKQVHDDLFEEMTSLRALQKQVRFPRNSISTTEHANTGFEDLIKTQKRHAAELRGLVRQIEYLSAKCKREEHFRSDLSYVKQYFTKRVEMHSRCTRADLSLVSAMGIPVKDIMDEQHEEADLAVGRVETSNGSRPSFRCVGLMVLAACRMKKSAARWATVKKSHDALMKMLVEMKSRQPELNRNQALDADNYLSKKGKDTKGGSVRSKRGQSRKMIAL